MTDDLLELFFRNTEEFAIIVLGSDGMVRRWNPGAERIFGWSAAEVVRTEGEQCSGERREVTTLMSRTLLAATVRPER